MNKNNCPNLKLSAKFTSDSAVHEINMDTGAYHENCYQKLKTDGVLSFSETRSKKSLTNEARSWNLYLLCRHANFLVKPDYENHCLKVITE